MSHRKEQVESTLMRAVSQIVTRELADPRISGLISITRVEVTPDFKRADVYISVLPAEKQRLCVKGLNSAAPHIHARVMKAVAIRTVPHLEFREDATLKKSAEIFDAIREGLEKDRNLDAAVKHDGDEESTREE